MSTAGDQTVVLLGTARSDGNTRSTVEHVFAGTHVELIDLAALNISPYDYQHRNDTDAFMPLVERVAAKSLWVLATPVYWYTMSAQLKIFMDRLSDLITIRKDLGRTLRGKSLAVLASGTDADLPEGFEAPFRLTADYLGMQYIGSFYQQFGKHGEPIRPSTAEARKRGALWEEAARRATHGAE